MTVDDLRNFGADTKAGLHICMGNESFYLRMVKMIPGDPNFEKLYDSIEKGDLEGAFSAAHALKGSTGNLSLTPIFAPVCEIVELLRNRTDTDYTELVEMIRKGRDELQRICEN
jgi:hypothetical protein